MTTLTSCAKNKEESITTSTGIYFKALKDIPKTNIVSFQEIGILPENIETVYIYIMNDRRGWVEIPNIIEREYDTWFYSIIIRNGEYHLQLTTYYDIPIMQGKIILKE